MSWAVPAGAAGTVATVGTFDGVHLGHREVIEEIARRARATGRQSLAVTFDPHPLAVVNPAAAPPMLTTTGERTAALATLPLDRLLVLRFDRALAALSPAEFLDTRARDVSLRINQPVTEIDGTRVLAPGDDPLRIGSTALLCFSPVGGATSGTLYVASPRGPQMAIRIFGGTGRVRVLRFEAQSRQWRP